MSTIVPPHPDPLRLALLQSIRTYPAISVLASAGGDHYSFRTRLAALITEADARLRAEPALGDTSALVEELRRLADDLPPETGAAAVALFVARGTARAVHLPVAVRDRVVIDETFATRDLVSAHARSPRYRVLTVGERLCRLYEGLGPVLERVDDGGFPLELAPRDEAQRADRLRHPRDRRRDQHLRRTVVAVDAALAAHVRDDPTPLVVVGAERRVAALREVSRHRHLIAAEVTRTADRLGVAGLAELVAPHVAALVAADQAAALTSLDEARGAKRYAAGVGEVWPLVSDGRVALLVVEQDFHYPARVDPVTRAVGPAADVAAPDVVDDLVDEAIESVLRARGRVTLVPDGTLADAGRIAVVVRW